jgi:Protein of unknown function (DUF3300)
VTSPIAANNAVEPTLRRDIASNLPRLWPPMMRYRLPVTVLLLIALVFSPEFAPVTNAQTSLPTAEQLDQLLAPIALYPDSLLAQITTASTNPQEILDVDNWLQQNPGLTGTALTDAAEKQGFDPAFIALVNFPQILEMMAQHIDDYAAIGEAFSADQGAVAASIQRLRADAYASGALRSTPQQQVEVEQSSGQTVYVIQPANPQVVYVPVYDPTVVYVRPAPGAFVAASMITFGVGIGIGTLLVTNQPWGWGGWGWNWRTRRAYYNRVIWVGWGRPYRSPRPWYRPRPIVWANRPGYRGDWRYRPRNYRPPGRPVNRPGYNRPPYGPGNRPGYNRPGGPSGPGAPNRPPSNRPNERPTNRPIQPPANRPGQPPANRPGGPSGPGAPNRPPSNRPNERPANGPNQRPPSQRPTDRPQSRPGDRSGAGTNPSSRPKPPQNSSQK